MSNDIIKKTDEESLVPSTSITNHFGDEKTINIKHVDNIQKTVIMISSQNEAGEYINREIEYCNECYNLFVLNQGEPIPKDTLFFRKEDTHIRDYTNEDIYDENLRLTDKAIREIRSFPILIASENEHYWGEAGSNQFAIYGIITDLQETDSGYSVIFNGLRKFPQQIVNNIAEDLGMGETRAIMPLNIHQWCIKKVNLAQALRKAGVKVPIVQ